MTRTRTAALLALGIAASWTAACGGSQASRAGSASASPSANESVAYETGGDDYGPPAEAAEPSPDRPGLGTEFGESVDSRVFEQPFERAASNPFAQVAIHYNDADGVTAQAEYRGGGLAPVAASTPYGGITIALTDESGNALPGFTAGDRTYVVGQAGQRYNLHITNQTAGRYEVVASVDGLDVIDGKSAGYSKRGYIVPANGTLVVDGFRTSDSTVAAFRFGAVRDSYASRTGDDRNVGVVGFAFFAERGSMWTTDELHRRETADPFPSKYAAPPPQ